MFLGEEIDDTTNIFYKATNPNPECVEKWRLSEQMPKWASRIRLLIKDIRVERVLDISEEDAKAEGVIPNNFLFYKNMKYKMGFKTLWNNINAERGYGCETNPLVWVIKYKLL